MRITRKMKTVFVLAIAMLFAGNVEAQETKEVIEVKEVPNYDQGFRLGFGLNVGYSVDDPYKLALGADARLQYDLSKRYSVTLTTGFNNLFVSKADGDDLGFIPVKAGFKAFVWDDQFYVMGEAGAGFAVTNGYNQTSLILAPTIGYASKYIDLSLRYEHYSDFPRLNNDGTLGEGIGQIGVRVAYGFKL